MFRFGYCAAGYVLNITELCKNSGNTNFKRLPPAFALLINQNDIC
jgi:hypothetical protein